MFETELKKYKIKGNFSFKSSELLKDKCNAPADQGGVYLIYKIVKEEEILVYIGSSGQRRADGTLKVRGGGMKDRIVNGYHPNKFGRIDRIKRHKAFPEQMQREQIGEIKFYWWVTYDDENSDFPTDIEKRLRDNYCLKFGKLPDWHSNKI